MHAFFKGGQPSTAPKEKSDISTKTGKVRHIPWVEKYRPKTVDDVAYQDEVVSVLKKTITGSDVPNLLFYGPPGTGKTSTILALARQLYGVDMMKQRVLELNASDERGISVVREKVKKFAMQTASATRSDGKPCPPFKIIILDETDSMTKPAQSALRRTMEKESKTTRFCLICNYVTRIIEPITSRCAKFRFKPLDGSILEKRLRYVCEQESVKCSDEALQMLMKVSEGDLRKAITYLQTAHRLKGEDGIEVNDITEIAGVIPDDDIERLVTAASKNSYEKLEEEVRDLMFNGHSGSQIILQLHDKLIDSDELSDKQKAVIFEKIAIVDKSLMDGADEYLQIMDLMSLIMNQICLAK